MPRIIVQMVEGRSLERKRALVKGLTEATAEALQISPERISIVLHEVQEDQLAHNGVLWCDREVKPYV